ncbi:conserved hypothetical protein [Billgrantia gudaonensis]|uniref:Flippase-like domain-containing protein n=1 Tax=Billgrantia gudaonensis TaxID=376427 RepID=A0A1G8ZJ54_9GAMM|nr:conserved hypothetical protein [Halomonas gudaonensis]
MTTAPLFRVLGSLGLLAVLALWLGPSELFASVERLAPGWVLLGLVLTLPQVALCAWRWRLTARLLGLPLSWRRSLHDYYLALFLNQVLPGGVMGDAARAWRHAGTSGQRGGAWRAVVIERASGQLAMLLITLAVLLASPLWHGLLGRALQAMAGAFTAISSLALGLGMLGLALGGVIAAAGARQLLRRPPRLLAGLGDDLRRSLLAASVWPRQLAGSLLVVASYALVFVCAARAIGVTLPLGTLLALAPPVLIAMLVPVAVAGWGVREGAAALIWAVAGLPPAQGVAVSATYGILVLVASLPGAFCLLVDLVRRRRASERGSGGLAQGEVEEGVISAGQGSRGGAERLGQRDDGRQRQAGPAGADQQRCHQQVQAVEHVGLEKARHRDATALHQHPRQPARGQQIEHVGRREAAIVEWQGEAGHVRGLSVRPDDPFADQMQRGCGGVVQQVQFGGHPAVRVEEHPHRVAAGHVAHGELGVVGGRGARAHHHGVDQGAQTVQMDPAFATVDVVGVTALGGNAPVQALAELSDGQTSVPGRHRSQAIEQGARRRVHRRRGLPAACRRETHDAVIRGRAAGFSLQLIPGRGEIEFRGGVAHAGSVVECHRAGCVERRVFTSGRGRPRSATCIR